jgi:hypothetical protein
MSGSFMPAALGFRAVPEGQGAASREPSAAVSLRDWATRQITRLQHRMSENMAAARASGALGDPLLARRLLG